MKIRGYMDHLEFYSRCVLSVNDRLVGKSVNLLPFRHAQKLARTCAIDKIEKRLFPRTPFVFHAREIVVAVLESS